MTIPETVRTREEVRDLWDGIAPVWRWNSITDSILGVTRVRKSHLSNVTGDVLDVAEEEATEEEVIDALLFGHEQAQAFIDMQEKMVSSLGKEKRPVEVKEMDLQHPLHPAIGHGRPGAKIAHPVKHQVSPGNAHRVHTARRKLFAVNRQICRRKTELTTALIPRHHLSTQTESSA